MSENIGKKRGSNRGRTRKKDEKANKIGDDCAEGLDPIPNPSLQCEIANQKSKKKGVKNQKNELAPTPIDKNEWKSIDQEVDVNVSQELKIGDGICVKNDSDKTPEKKNRLFNIKKNEVPNKRSLENIAESVESELIDDLQIPNDGILVTKEGNKKRLKKKRRLEEAKEKNELETSYPGKIMKNLECDTIVSSQNPKEDEGNVFPATKESEEKPKKRRRRRNTKNKSALESCSSGKLIKDSVESIIRATSNHDNMQSTEDNKTPTEHNEESRSNSDKTLDIRATTKRKRSAGSDKEIESIFENASSKVDIIDSKQATEIENSGTESNMSKKRKKNKNKSKNEEQSVKVEEKLSIKNDCEIEKNLEHSLPGQNESKLHEENRENLCNPPDNCKILSKKSKRRRRKTNVFGSALSINEMEENIVRTTSNFAVPSDEVDEQGFEKRSTENTEEHHYKKEKSDTNTKKHVSVVDIAPISESNESYSNSDSQDTSKTRRNPSQRPPSSPSPPPSSPFSPPVEIEPSPEKFNPNEILEQGHKKCKKSKSKNKQLVSVECHLKDSQPQLVRESVQCCFKDGVQKERTLDDVKQFHEQENKDTYNKNEAKVKNNSVINRDIFLASEQVCPGLGGKSMKVYNKSDHKLQEELVENPSDQKISKPRKKQQDSVVGKIPNDKSGKNSLQNISKENIEVKYTDHIDPVLNNHESEHMQITIGNMEQGDDELKAEKFERKQKVSKVKVTPASEPDNRKTHPQSVLETNVEKVKIGLTNVGIEKTSERESHELDGEVTQNGESNLKEHCNNNIQPDDSKKKKSKSKKKKHSISHVATTYEETEEGEESRPVLETDIQVIESPSEETIAVEVKNSKKPVSENDSTNKKCISNCSEPIEALDNVDLHGQENEDKNRSRKGKLKNKKQEKNKIDKEIDNSDKVQVPITDSIIENHQFSSLLSTGSINYNDHDNSLSNQRNSVPKSHISEAARDYTTSTTLQQLDFFDMQKYDSFAISEAEKRFAKILESEYDTYKTNCTTELSTESDIDSTNNNYTKTTDELHINHFEEIPDEMRTVNPGLQTRFSDNFVSTGTRTSNSDEKPCNSKCNLSWSQVAAKEAKIKSEVSQDHASENQQNNRQKPLESSKPVCIIVADRPSRADDIATVDSEGFVKYVSKREMRKQRSRTSSRNDGEEVSQSVEEINNDTLMKKSHPNEESISETADESDQLKSMEANTAQFLLETGVWMNKWKYHDAEVKHFENKEKIRTTSPSVISGTSDIDDNEGEGSSSSKPPSPKRGIRRKSRGKKRNMDKEPCGELVNHTDDSTTYISDKDPTNLDTSTSDNDDNKGEDSSSSKPPSSKIGKRKKSKGKKRNMDKEPCGELANDTDDSTYISDKDPTNLDKSICDNDENGGEDLGSSEPPSSGRGKTRKSRGKKRNTHEEPCRELVNDTDDSTYISDEDQTNLDKSICDNDENEGEDLSSREPPSPGRGKTRKSRGKKRNMHEEPCRELVNDTDDSTYISDKDRANLDKSICDNDENEGEDLSSSEPPSSGRGKTRKSKGKKRNTHKEPCGKLTNDTDDSPYISDKDRTILDKSICDNDENEGEDLSSSEPPSSGRGKTRKSRGKKRNTHEEPCREFANDTDASTYISDEDQTNLDTTISDNDDNKGEDSSSNKPPSPKIGKRRKARGKKSNKDRKSHGELANDTDDSTYISDEDPTNSDTCHVATAPEDSNSIHQQDNTQTIENDETDENLNSSQKIKQLFVMILMQLYFMLIYYASGMKKKKKVE